MNDSSVAGYYDMAVEKQLLYYFCRVLLHKMNANYSVYCSRYFFFFITHTIIMIKYVNDRSKIRNEDII